MTEHNRNPNEERNIFGRHGRRNGIRRILGLVLAIVGGYWLTINITNDVSLIAGDPWRVVLPGLVILLGLAGIFTRRVSRRTH